MSDSLRIFHGKRTAPDGTTEAFTATATNPSPKDDTGEFVTFLTLKGLEDEPREIVGETEWETNKMAEMGIQILWAMQGIDVVSEE